MVTSIEPKVTSWAEMQIGALGWQHAPQQNGRELDARVDDALRKAPSKSGGAGTNKPDHVIILDNGASRVPVLCEWKGSKGALRDQKTAALRSSDGYLRYGAKGIDKYAHLGAAYYASRVVGPAGHPLALALAVNGYYKAPSDLEPVHEIALYAVSKDASEKIMWVGDYTDFSFLKKENLVTLLQEVDDALNPETAKLRKANKSESLDGALKRLNEFLHTEHGIVPSYRVNVIASLMIASLGVTDYNGNVQVKPLKDEDLYGGSGNSRDGAIILDRVEDYLKQRTPQLPIDKQQSVLDALRPTLLDSSLSAKAKNGMSPLKAAFHIVSQGLLPHYHDNRAIDFAGKLFNEMYAWIDVPDAGSNDVVLTPKRTTDLMVEITQIDSDSYVWDWTLGTGAFLVSAMNVMLADARERYQGEELRKKENQIKVDQLLGIEKLGSVYVLAVLNMILMGDGSSNIIHGDSHEYDGKYQEREGRVQGFFPASTLVLNPPYSAPGNGLIFVKEAFAMMNARGTGKYGAVIIQDSAGSGKATEYCRDILKFSSLVASIKMPADLFIGKAGVQTSIYVFKVGTAHRTNSLVKFIDFRNDGYKRSNRKKVKDPSFNLRPIDDPDRRYAEVAAIVTGRKRDTSYYPLGELYFEDTIDPKAGNDWNFDQHVKIDTKPTLADFRKTVADNLAWEVSQLLKQDDLPKIDGLQMQDELRALELKHGVTEWREFPLGGSSGLFTLKTPKRKFDANKIMLGLSGHPYVVRSDANNGIKGLTEQDETYLNDGNTISLGQDTATVFYQPDPYFTGDKVKVLVPNASTRLNKLTAQALLAAIRRSVSSMTWGQMFNLGVLNTLQISLPVVVGGDPSWEYMEDAVRALEAERVRTHEAEHVRTRVAYSLATGLSDYMLAEREGSDVPGNSLR
ncbi:hypothetical protein MB46_18660 [Arthrobacter alpinus]|uniref:N-6 DNA methylase n=1 Tax=Arthrobacter alpinus TaxID=656366 RepID=UPI000678A9A7|nr:N-6 DNA methylase [Arthrobacter alpinus]ALV47214.1 hypothetical protein MB46_18660 [Arthrobacter alpinus]